MSKWDNFKKAVDVTSKVDNVKNTASNIRKNGVINTAKDMVKRKTYRQAGKVALQASKTFLRFLITPPWGWVVSGIIILGAIFIFGDNPSNVGLNNTQGNNLVTTEQYASMQVSCPSTSSGKISGSLEIKPGNNEYTLDEVVKFASSSLKSTWKVSDDAAAAYFLSHNAAVATGYGLTPSNIGEITQVVKNAGVSPVFFYLYAVTEGGGAGGFINHYGSNTGAGAKADALRDAEYLVQWANSVGGSPATEVWSLGNMPTDGPQKILDKMPSGSLGRVYIQATAAVTMELNELAGVTWDRVAGYSFGKPITHMMNMITSVGGDITAGDQISVDTSGFGSSADCNPLGGSDSELKSGGMTLEEARKFMLDKYQNAPITYADISGAAMGTPDIRDNCVAFSAFFIHKYTSLSFGNGNGMDVASNLVAANNIKTDGKMKLEHTPSVYSVFSIGPFGGPNLSGDVGHTGVILGIDKERGKAILGQANYGMAFTSIDSWNSGVNAMEFDLDLMTEANGWSFANITDYMTDLK